MSVTRNEFYFPVISRKLTSKTFYCYVGAVITKIRFQQTTRF